MRTRVTFVILFALAFLALAPATAAVADSESHTYELDMEGPNFGEAPNGDRVAVTGHAEFSVNPKSAHGGGRFTHTSSSGVIRGAGTWSAVDLLDYQSYGCGIVHFPSGDVTLPPNFCGGKVKMSVTLTGPLGTLDGILTVFCIIGPNPPNSAEEGITLLVPGIINFNKAVGGDNHYVRTS